MDANLTRRIVLLALAAVLVWALFKVLEPFWNALAWAVCLAFLLGPLQSRLAAKFRGRRGTAAGVITALTPVVLLAPLTLLALLFAEQVTALVQRLRASSLTFDSTLLVQLERFPLIGPAIRWFRATVPVHPAKLQEWVMNGAESALGTVASLGGGMLAGAVGTLVGFFLMLFLLFFMLRDGPAMLRRLTLLVPLEGQRREALLKLVGNTTRAVVYGTVLTALLQGLLVAIGFAIAGIPSPVVFGVLAALLALLPAGGAAIVWLPAVLWLIAVQSWGWAIFMAIWGVGVSVSDNFLRPMLISSHAPVSTLAVFIGVVGGASAFGGVGIIIGPVLLTLISALVHFADDSTKSTGGA
jgi:predicted PurR-regulated permease PerM